MHHFVILRCCCLCCRCCSKLCVVLYSAIALGKIIQLHVPECPRMSIQEYPKMSLNVLSCLLFYLIVRCCCCFSKLCVVLYSAIAPGTVLELHVPECPGMSWNVLKCPRLSQNVPECLWMSLYVPECSLLFWNDPDCPFLSLIAEAITLTMSFPWA